MEQVDARGRPRAMYQTECLEPSKTVQSDSHDASIQTILTRHGVSGVVDHLNQAELVYGDVSELTDYADAMRTVREAETAFFKLPSKVREVFGHDAAKWLDAANDGISAEQADKLVALGFLKREGDSLQEVQDDATVKPVAVEDAKPVAEPTG